MQVQGVVETLRLPWLEMAQCPFREAGKLTPVEVVQNKKVFKDRDKKLLARARHSWNRFRKLQSYEVQMGPEHFSHVLHSVQEIVESEAENLGPVQETSLTIWTAFLRKPCISVRSWPKRGRSS